MASQAIRAMLDQMGGEDAAQILEELLRVKQRSNARLGSGINKRSVRKIVSKLEAEKRR